MVEGSSFHRLGHHITSKIRTLLFSFPQDPSGYDEIAPKIEFWIEYVLREQFTTVDELVEGVSYVAWGPHNSGASIARFLKEFRDAPNRSEQARSFVEKLCEHILRWFAIVSVENLLPDECSDLVGDFKKGSSFKGAAWLVGRLIQRGLFSHEVVRRHLVKPLISHHYTDRDDVERSVRVMAIYNLFITARNQLLQGLLDPEDVQTCFKALDTKILPKVGNLDPAKLKEFRECHTAWLKRKEEEQKNTARVQEPRGEGEKDAIVDEVPAEVRTPVAFAHVTIDIGIPLPIFHGIEPPSALHDVPEPLSDTFTNDRVAGISSPTLTISTVSDWTSTEPGDLEDIGEGGAEQMPTRHKTFYFEDGNVEIACEDTVFRVHSTTISFSSSKLRDILSPSTLLNAPMPEGCPRIVFMDSAEDFCVLLKMIYTPGFPARHEVPKFSVFASLLRMTTKYGFSDVRDQLVKDLKGAYPTKWEAYQVAEVLGEDVFGSPKPHPNAVLNLFMAQNIRFAIPFAAYRASLGGISALMSDKPCTILPRLTLASTLYGMERTRGSMVQAAYTITHKERLLSICPNTACVLNVGTKPMELRMEALTKLHNVMVSEREGGLLSTPSFGGLVCAKCAKEIEGSHAARRRTCWELLPTTFSVAKSWDEL